MIWGVEGRHIYMPPSYAGTPAAIAALTPAQVISNGGVTLNRRVDDAGLTVMPVYWVEKIGGLAGIGDSDDVRDNVVGAPGERARRAYRRGKTITYEGTIRALTRSALRQAEYELRRAASDQSHEGMIVVTPHPLYDGSGAYRYFPARILTCEIVDEIKTSPGRRSHGHESGFVVAARNSRLGDFSYRDQANVGYP